MEVSGYSLLRKSHCGTCRISESLEFLSRAIVRADFGRSLGGRISPNPVNSLRVHHGGSRVLRNALGTNFDLRVITARARSSIRSKLRNSEVLTPCVPARLFLGI